MTPVVTVIDYGMGNLFSVSRAFEKVGATVELVTSASAVREAEYLVLPGVGAFADGMSGLSAFGLVKAIQEYARSGRPFLGICLGMQMMLDTSEEFGRHEGLGLIPGEVKRISDNSTDRQPRKVPHVGWAPLFPATAWASWSGTLLDVVKSGEAAYFVHSFAAVPNDRQYRLADADYDGWRISAVIRRGLLYGCQFHPEKSGPTGLRILKSFISLRPQ